MSKDVRTCPYCKSAIQQSDEFVGCSECGTRHHKCCWDQYGQCSVFGCRASSERIRPRLTLLIPPAVLFLLAIPRINFAWLIAFVIPPALVICAALGFYFLIHVIEAGFIRQTIGRYEMRWNLYFLVIYFVSVLLFIITWNVR